MVNWHLLNSSFVKVISVQEKTIFKRKIIFLLTGIRSSCALISRSTGRTDLTRNNRISERSIRIALKSASKIDQILPTVSIPIK